MMQVDIYTETSARGPRKQDMVAGYMLVYQDASGREANAGHFEALEEKSPQEADLLILLKALKRLSKECDITIVSSSTYIKNAISAGWVENWKINDWKTAKGEPVKHVETWKRLCTELDRHHIQFGADKGNQQWLIYEVNRRAGKE